MRLIAFVQQTEARGLPHLISNYPHVLLLISKLWRDSGRGVLSLVFPAIVTSLFSSPAVVVTDK